MRGRSGHRADAHGHIYTTLTASSSSSGSSPCAACVQIYSDGGTLVKTLDAPTLSGAPGAPQLTDVSVDAHDNVYVSDYGQQAVYFFPHAKAGKHGPTVVVQNSPERRLGRGATQRKGRRNLRRMRLCQRRAVHESWARKVHARQLLPHRYDRADRRRRGRSRGRHDAGRPRGRIRLDFVADRWRLD